MPFWTKYTRKKQTSLVKKNWQILIFIPWSEQTREMCTIALEQSWEAISWVNLNICTEKMYIIAVKQSWEALKLIPKPMRTEKVCLIAVKQNWRAIGDIPHDIINNSDSFYSSLVESDFSMSGIVPRVFYENFIKAIWVKYGEPRAMLEILKRINTR
jgi:hypothetical protein